LQTVKLRGDQRYGELSHITSVAETISSLVEDCVPKDMVGQPIPSECFIIHNVAMASHSTERREVKDWDNQIWADSRKSPTFAELLQFLQEQVNGRKANLSETWMEIFKLQIKKPTNAEEATAAVTSFISQAEKFGLKTSDHELVLSSLILSKLQNFISTEELRRITDTLMISNFQSKTSTESQVNAVGKAGRNFSFFESQGGSKCQNRVSSCIHGGRFGKGDGCSRPGETTSPSSIRCEKAKSDVFFPSTFHAFSCESLLEFSGPGIVQERVKMQVSP
jgi:hypothetical protein